MAPSLIIPAQPRIIQNAVKNGDFYLWMRGAQGSATRPLTVAVGDTYAADCWLGQIGGGVTGEWQRNQDTARPTVAQSGHYSPYTMAIVCSTAQAVIGAADYVRIVHRMEGHVFAPIAYRPWTLSFWAYCTTAGKRYVAIWDGGSTQYFVAPFTIANASTWQRFVIPIPATATGTYDFARGLALQIVFPIVNNSGDQTATYNAWTVAAVKSHGSDLVDLKAVNDQLSLAQVALYPGTNVPTFEAEPYTDLKRYCAARYFKTFRDTIAPAPGTGSSDAMTCIPNDFTVKGDQYFEIWLSEAMRGTITGTLWNCDSGWGLGDENKVRAYDGLGGAVYYKTGCSISAFTTYKNPVFIAPYVANDVNGYYFPAFELEAEI